MTNIKPINKTAQDAYDLAVGFGLTLSALARILGTSARTLQKKKKTGVLFNTMIAGRVEDLQALLMDARRVLGPQRVNNWFSRKEVALGNMTPFSLLRTKKGRAAVRNVLGALKEGIFL